MTVYNVLTSWYVIMVLLDGSAVMTGCYNLSYDVRKESYLCISCGGNAIMDCDV